MALWRNIVVISLVAILFGSCSNTRNLPEGESLFLGGDVSLKDKSAPKDELKALKEDLEEDITPRPNKKLLGMRLKLRIYNFAGEPKKEKGLRYWLRNKVGEPPALTSQFNMANTKQFQVNTLQNRGFYYSTIEGEVKTKRKKTRVHFDVTTGAQYTIRNTEFVKDSSTVSAHVADQAYYTLLRKDAPFNLELIKGERERIDKQLKEIGYYFFKPDYLIVKADTTVGEMKVDMYISVKENIPENAGVQYRINNVYILPDADRRRRRREGEDTTAAPADTIFYERYYIIGKTKKYKPFVFTQAMQFQPGDWYSRTEQNTSLNRLVNMGTFKFVKNEFVPVEGNKLNTYYHLTSYPKKAMRGEITGLTKNDGRVGSQLTLSWRNRNTMRGAELFTIKGTAGFEKQVGGAVKRPDIYQFGIEPSLTFPRFVIPFLHPKSSSLFVPRTTARVGYDLVLRQGLYRIHSLKAGYGYSWKEDVRKEHQLFPLNVNYVRTDTLNRNAPLNVTYSNLVFNGLILGPTYQYTFNSRGSGAPRHYDYYFDGLIDLSGNIPGAVQGADVNGADAQPPKKILGANFAQYVKLQADFRHYTNYTPNINSIWVNRVLVGYGIPYGNSSVLPNIKQFFSGGNSSLRGFPSRLVGPGEFHYKQDPAKVFIETAGDIKLEVNTEIRAQLINFVHGAAFVDAGNIWTFRESPLFPGGKFETDRFLKQLAVSAGLGLRFDFKILVLRLDLGMPLRKPWLPEGEKWVFNAIEFGDPVWRKENLVLNLGIGYPF